MRPVLIAIGSILLGFSYLGWRKIRSRPDLQGRARSVVLLIWFTGGAAGLLTGNTGMADAGGLFFWLGLAFIAAGFYRGTSG